MSIQNDLERIANVAEVNKVLSQMNGYQDISDAWLEIAKSIKDCIESIKPTLKVVGEIVVDEKGNP